MKILTIGMVFLLTIAAGSAHASLSFVPTNNISGDNIAGSLTADFTDVSGGVQLVITSNLASGENLQPAKALYFNFNPSKDPMLSSLTFTLTGNTNFSQQATVTTGADAYKADGDGNYDILFVYSTNAFAGGQSQTYKITGTNISASDFIYQSVGGANGSWYAAAHVQNTPGTSGSGWVGATITPTPIPAAAWLLGSGLMGLFGFRRKENV